MHGALRIVMQFAMLTPVACSGKRESPDPSDTVTVASPTPKAPARPPVLPQATDEISLADQDDDAATQGDLLPQAAEGSRNMAFVDQVRDPTWAPRTEAELRRRFAAIRGGRLAQVDCRHDQCQLVISGTEVEIGQAMADLESQRGLPGYARDLVLGGSERRPDGTMMLRAYARFTR